MGMNSIGTLSSWLGQSAVVRHYRKLKYSRSLPKYFAMSHTEISDQQKSIIFLCSDTNISRSGVKVIYNHAVIINELNKNLQASILHPYKPNYQFTWFNHGATIKKYLGFDKNHDFVMIPEFCAVPHARLLYNISIRYGIYVQIGM